VNVACVKLTFCLANLSVKMLRDALASKADQRKAELESGVAVGLAQLADVPDDMVRVEFQDGGTGEQDVAAEADWARSSPTAAEKGKEGGADKKARASKATKASTQRESLEGSEEWSGGESDEAESKQEYSIVVTHERDARPRLRVVATVRAAGARYAWASASIKEAMADKGHFLGLMETLICSQPNIIDLRAEADQPVDFKWARLEELDVPRREFQPAEPLPAPVAELPVDEDIALLRKNMRYERPALLQFPHRPLDDKTGNAQALADGFRSSASEPHLEELGLWGCGLGDFGAASLARALETGCGARLQTLLLDDNGIASAGATR